VFKNSIKIISQTNSSNDSGNKNYYRTLSTTEARGSSGISPLALALIPSLNS